MKKLFVLLFINIWIFQVAVMPVFAKADWPADISLQAEAGIVMDMESGTVLYGKGSHTAFPPASITKILTALLVIENCEMDEIVTFSNDAVNNVEAGSSNAELSVGDKLSVEDCLYAMLLKSANEAANALAEHVGGSRSGFVDMMNERIAQLGCTDSHFANPSGLNSAEQNVSPYDMALIGCAAFAEPELVKIASTLKYDLPPTIRNSEGSTIYMEHKMLLNTKYHYDAAKAGKTGYTLLAGNTLITYAERDGRKLVAVVLKDKMPNHYVDTIALFDFGFDMFSNYNISENTKIFQGEGQTVNAGGKTYPLSELILDKDGVITLPADSAFAEADETLSTDLPADHPERAVAVLQYRYNDRMVGQAYFTEPEKATPSELSGTEALPPVTVPADMSGTGQKSGGIGGILVIAAAVLVVLGAGGAAYVIYSKKKEEKDLELRRARRRKRLQDMGYSEEEFTQMLNQHSGSRRRGSGSEPQKDPSGGRDQTNRSRHKR